MKTIFSVSKRVSDTKGRMKSSFSVSKSGAGPQYSKGDIVELLYEVYLPCCNHDQNIKQGCKNCQDGQRGRTIEKGTILITLGDGTIHEYIEDVLLTKCLRHGGAIYFCIDSADAFGDIGLAPEVEPNQTLCFKVEELTF